MQVPASRNTTTAPAASPVIRPLQAADWPAVAEIYRLGMDTGCATFETTVPAWTEWEARHHAFARFVAVAEERVAGWVALSPVSQRWVYRGVAEVSVYVHPDFRGRGVGRQLLTAVVSESEAHGIWTLNAAIFPENGASLALHAAAGFRRIGTKERVAQRDGKWHDNILLERRSNRVG